MTNGSAGAAKRRIYIIDQPFQAAVVMRVLICIIIFALFIVGGLYFSYRNLEGFQMSEDLREAFFQSALRTGAAAVLMLIAMGCYFVLLTHRIAGPVFRLRKELQSMRQGEPGQPIRLREGDYLRGVVQEFNGMLDDLNARQEKWAAVVRKVQVLGELQSAGQGGSDKAAELVKSLTEDVRR